MIQFGETGEKASHKAKNPMCGILIKITHFGQTIQDLIYFFALERLIRNKIVSPNYKVWRNNLFSGTVVSYDSFFYMSLFKNH
jgi:hypothetical protein